MTAAAAAAAFRLRWLPPAFLLLLVLPLHPYWLDSEQVRRGLLLMLCGAAALALALAQHQRQTIPLPAPLAIPGARWFALFLLWMLATSLLHAGSLQPWDAAYRLAHFLALFVLLWLGVVFPAESWLRASCWLLIVTTAFGLLQRLGLAEWAGYGTPGEPVSVFGNLNVAAEFTAIAAAAAAATAASGLRPAKPAIAALALAGAYLAVNGSRSGLLITPLAMLPLLASGVTWQRKVLLALALLIGCGMGAGIDRLAVDPGRPPTAAGSDPRRDTVAVRFEIWNSSLHMAKDAWFLGMGPGQFPVQYPRFRSQREIELSSHGRELATEVGTAHNDWLELLVEGGLPGLVLFIGFFAQLIKNARRTPHALLPLCALGLLMCVRAPLGNAPAVAIALLLGATVRAAPAAATFRGWPAKAIPLLAGALALLLGILPVWGNYAFAAYVRAKARGEPVDTSAIERATAMAPFVPAFWEALARERQVAAQDATAAQSALAAAERALALRPHEPSFLLLRADLLRQLGRNAAARLDLDAAAVLDPGDPQWRVQLSALAFMAGDHDAAIAVVWMDPHPTLKARLPNHFALLEAKLRANKDPAAERYAAERAFAEALLSLPDQQELARTNRLAMAAMRAFFQANLLYKDARPWWLVALQALDVEDRSAAEKAAQEVRKSKLEVPPWQRALIGEQGLARLRTVAGWVDLLK